MWNHICYTYFVGLYILGKRNLEELNWNGYVIKVPPLELQLNVTRRRERIDRVELIEEYMNKTLTL